MSYRTKTKPASMRVQKPKEVAERRTCGECARLEPNMENLNYKHEPFMGYCPFGTRGWNRARAKGVTYYLTDACEHFAQKGGSL